MDQALNIVSCAGLDCGVCGILETISRAINFMLAVSLAAAVFMSVIGGILFLLAEGKSEKLETAKEVIKSTIKGFSLVLLAWLAINTLFQIAGSNQKDWWRFSCGFSEGTTENNSLEKILNPQGIIRSVKEGGIIGGFVSPLTGADELMRMYQSVGEEELMVVSLVENGTLSPWAILGKNGKGEDEIFYLDVSKIKRLSVNDKSSLIKVALAEGELFNELQQFDKYLEAERLEGAEEVAKMISQLVFSFVEGRADQVVLFLKKPQGLKPDEVFPLKNIPSEISDQIEKAKKCFFSEGVWYRLKSPQGLFDDCFFGEKMLKK